MKKIIFMGTPQFAAEVLTGLLNSPYEIIAVVTQPDRPVGRKRILTESPVKQLAKSHQIPVYQPEKLSGSPEMETLMKLGADLIVTAAYGQFLPTKLIESTPYTAINVHASLLPKYRGGAPIHYAIWRGERETGVSIMYMTRQMDAGDVLAQRSCMIEQTDDVGLLFEKLATIGRELLLDTLVRLFNHEITAVKQDESQVIFSPQITKEQEQIHWEQSASQVDCHVRAFRPFPTTYTWLDGNRVKIWAGAPFDYQGENAPVGTIVAVKRQQLIVQCGQQTYYAIQEWQESGKKRMTIEEYLKGNAISDIVGKQLLMQEEG
ncbi:MAG: methionyl-tRNA formyltransferase [Aerococcaceae bacterium]|nr:methionyl-tRNA formyltransferase [Aerococcaceae bacterium]